MLGTFNNDQPVIEIEVQGVTGISKKISALVDSGFNGYLQIPFVDAFPLGLVLVGVQANTLETSAKVAILRLTGARRPRST
ncbi:MAG: hypothetical protein NUV84_05580 [Candidatus Uhrbacteria bacterium]|nr:hypothetical protein [Candidatus Uhrbacteria bacterium]